MPGPAAGSTATSRPSAASSLLDGKIDRRLVAAREPAELERACPPPRHRCGRPRKQKNECLDDNPAHEKGPRKREARRSHADASGRRALGRKIAPYDAKISIDVWPERRLKSWPETPFCDIGQAEQHGQLSDHRRADHPAGRRRGDSEGFDLWLRDGRIEALTRSGGPPPSADAPKSAPSGMLGPFPARSRPIPTRRRRCNAGRISGAPLNIIMDAMARRSKIMSEQVRIAAQLHALEMLRSTALPASSTT